jgi:hypothetical protein
MKQMGFFSQDEMGVLERRFGSEEKMRTLSVNTRPGGRGGGSVPN